MPTGKTQLPLLCKNVSERIVDKDNHARDAMKYMIMSLPEPSLMVRDKLREDCRYLAEIRDYTSAYIRYQQNKPE
jgi:hypothetical protein